MLVYISSTNNRCVIFWLGAWDKLYPSVLLKYHAMGFSARVNNLTQKESPCKIPLVTLIGPIFSLPSLVFTSIVILHVFMTDLMRCIRLLCIPCISSVVVVVVLLLLLLLLLLLIIIIIIIIIITIIIVVIIILSFLFLFSFLCLFLT